MGMTHSSKTKQPKDAYENQKGNLIEKLVHVNRTAKVVKGGQVFGFAATVVVGDGIGKIGMGRGKGKEVPVAIQKAMDDARKNMVSIYLKKDTLQHTVNAKHGASKIFMKPASEGTGIIAGGAMRAVFEVSGVKDVLAKCLGSTNPINVARATIKGLKEMSTPHHVARKRGKSIEEIGGQHDR